MGTWGRRLVIAGLVAAALAIAGGVALLVAGGGPHTVTITSAPPPQRLQNPPWGFTGGWGDYCYRPLAGPAGYSANLVNPAQPCPDGTTRFGTAQQIAAKEDLASQAGGSSVSLDAGGLPSGSARTRSEGRTTDSYRWRASEL